MRSRFSVGMGLLLLAAASAAAQGRWQFLGEARVDGAVDHDRIQVTAAKGDYRAIQFRVQKAPIEFDRVVLRFGNGSSEELQVKERIPTGGQTRVIDVPADNRIIESVEFWYLRANWGKVLPQVRLFGMR